jgi:hypothetical protein
VSSYEHSFIAHYSSFNARDDLPGSMTSRDTRELALAVPANGVIDQRLKGVPAGDVGQ